MSEAVTIPKTQEEIVARSEGTLAAYVELTKPRIAMMVLVATAVGFLLAIPESLNAAWVTLLIHTLIGTALVGGGANAWNQLVEEHLDRQMNRTKNRPLPSGRLTRIQVRNFALLISVGGTAYLLITVNAIAAATTAAAWLLYVLLYTPMKRVTPHCVFLGAIPGALPPVIGWAAATAALPRAAWIPFAVLFFWQFPHFAAISWLYREDYRRAGFRMLSVADTDGSQTSLYMITHTLALLAVTLLPTFYGICGVTYACAAAILGLLFLACGILFVMFRTKGIARLHLFASVTYLPVLFAFMLLDKTG